MTKLRFSAGTIANALAWAVVGLLILAALLTVDRLGFIGLFILGGLTWLVCSLAQLDQAAPTWGTEVFRAGMTRPRTPEQRAAAQAEREATLSPLRFYARCGMGLTAIGAAGFAWQIWAGP